MKKEVESKNQRYPEDYSLEWVKETFGYRDPNIDFWNWEAYAEPGAEDHYVYGGHGPSMGSPYADVRVLVRTDTTHADASRLMREIMLLLDEVVKFMQEKANGE